MEEESMGMCGRNKEINEIHDFISSRVKTRKSGILYVTGQPGTGKTMTIQLVLDRIKNVPTVNINCMKAQSSKSILTRICCSVGLERFIKYNESEMIDRLTKKFTCRTCDTHLIVLDEMDLLPKSKNVDLVRTIFSWPNQANSKLILIGIANTCNLTSRYQALSSIISTDYQQFTKVVFKPYTSTQIRSILQWYIENDENFEDAVLEPKALDMIARKFSRENGDIRSAINALRCTIDDSVKQQRTEIPKLTQYPTPPATPPPSPCKEKTSIASVANSVKKRQKITNHVDDAIPLPHQIILTSIYKLCSDTKDIGVDSKACKDLTTSLMRECGLFGANDDYRAMLDNLELQGLIGRKRGRPREKIFLKATEVELSRLVQRKDMIMNLINKGI